MTTWYRVDATLWEGGRLTIRVHEYPVVAVTPRGVHLSVWGQRKWVSASARKRFAYPTLELAKASFIARKKRQILLLSTQLVAAKRLLRMAEQGVDDSYELNFNFVEHTDV